MKDLTNLLEETLEVLKRHGRKTADVKWVGSDKCWCTWEEFELIAKTANYDSGYGGAQVAENLLIVGSDWHMERGEYDGSEWWKFYEKIVKPKLKIKLKALIREQSQDSYSYDFESMNEVKVK